MQGSIITIDSREPNHIRNLKWSGALTAVATLDCGDVQIITPVGELILVERKTPHDLLESIKDRRLFNQVTAMVQKTQWSYLLVEGDFLHHDGYVKDTGWQWSSLQGALLSIQELGCAIIYDPDFHGAIERIVNRSRNDVKVMPRRGGYVFSEAEQILASLPGIGAKKAQEYLAKFNGNVAMAISILTAPHDGKVNQLDGWGKKSRDNLVAALGGRLEVFFDE